jgi:hypothetical protein
MKYFPKWLQFIAIVILIGPVISLAFYLEDNFGISTDITTWIIILLIAALYIIPWIKDIQLERQKIKHNFLLDNPEIRDYSKEEIDNILRILKSLKKNKKPNLFSRSIYKSLYNSNSKNFLIKNYDNYLIIFNYINDRERYELEKELVFMVINQYKKNIFSDLGSQSPTG